MLQADRLLFFRGTTYGFSGLVHLSDAEVLERNDPTRLFVLETHRRDKRQHIFISDATCMHLERDFYPTGVIYYIPHVMFNVVANSKADMGDI